MSDEQSFQPGEDTGFKEWLNYGMKRGWCGVPVCITHDGLPASATEDDQQINGLDPCVHILRLYSSDEERDAVEAYFYPYEYRRVDFVLPDEQDENKAT